MNDFLVMSIVAVWCVVITIIAITSFEQHQRITSNEKKINKNARDIIELKNKLLIYEQERQSTKKTEGTPGTETSAASGDTR